MRRERHSILSTVLRCLRLRCPVCGQSSIVESLFKIKHYCPECDALFKREDGFFVGAIAVNVVTTELVIMVVYFIYLLLSGADYEAAITLLLTLALLFPIAFYHHSWSIWLSFDHLIETLPKHVK